MHQVSLSRIAKVFAFGLFTGVIGLCAAFLPVGYDLEENLGLGLLFGLRGTRQPPSEVVVVSMDEASAHALKVPDNPDKWPRSLHARLVDRLVSAGASVIAFDVLFHEDKGREEDLLFARSISKAQNVVLCEGVRRERIRVGATDSERPGEVSIERLVLPTATLGAPAVGHAPFPLPKVPVRVSQYWAFKTGTGDMPTLPIVAFQVFHMGLYDEFVRLLRYASPARAATVPTRRELAGETAGIEKAVSEIREIFKQEPATADRMLSRLEGGDAGIERWKVPPLRSLIQMYRGSDSQYLNFYGPPETITTISYHEVLGLGADQALGSLDLRGKAVFVGSSGAALFEQRDGFHTVFSGSSGRDISGVEIAATAFANLVQGAPVRPLSPGTQAAVIFFWGLVIAVSCRLLPMFAAIASGLVLSGVYLVVVEYHFTRSAIWYPVVITLFFQTPVAVFGAVLWKYLDTNRERRNVRKALNYYLPSGVADRLSKSVVDMTAADQHAYGICLSTDAEGYTSLSERMGPAELGAFLNRYYETIFRPIRSRGGIVSDVVGDAALAVWVAPQPEREGREAACAAALEITRGLKAAGGEASDMEVPTRIGLHAGDIMLGNVGAIDHYEYRPVGDIVNTATRVQGLNKHIGTSVLASAEAVKEIRGFLTREVGRFLLAGKSKPLVVHEVICRIEDSCPNTVELRDAFAAGLSAFRSRRWAEALMRFEECCALVPGDGPSHMYRALCEEYEKKPPGEDWEDVIRMERK